jgi:oligopeptide/dipeptide ABC transporter ATP-binding protein
VAELFARPQHPYTIGLLGSIPKLHLERETLTAIQGQVPNPAQMPAGCRFMPRCPFSTEKCREDPPLAAVTPGDEAACWYAPLEEKSAAVA